MTCPVCRSENPARRQILQGVRLATRGSLPVVRSADPAGREVLRRMRHGPGRRHRRGDRRPARTTAPDRARRRAAARLRPVRGPRRLHAVRRGTRRRGGPRDPDPLLRPGARDHRRATAATVEKFIGDAVMAVWGAPIAHEDDAERAVRAALELVDAVRDPRPGDPGAGRRPDRRGGRHARRDQPGHGRGRPRQHRRPAPVGRGARHRPRRRGDPARRVAVRSPSSRPASRRSRARPARSRPGARCGSSPSAAAAAAARRSRPRSSAATTSCGCSRTCSTPRAASAAPGSSRSSGRPASARAASAGSS